ncbi:pLS20_p028 family conjugation system transmembrane protein, partial [Enterococcus faecalis]
SGMTKEVYKLIDFYNYKPIKEMIDTYQPIILAIGAIAVTYFGYRIMSIKKTDKNVFVESVILAMTIVVLLPWGLQQGAGLVGAG